MRAPRLVAEDILGANRAAPDTLGWRPSGAVSGALDLSAVAGAYLVLSEPALRWRSVGGGVAMARLRSGEGDRLWLLRARAGAVLPRHGHNGSELTVVLQGAYVNDDQVYSAGDLEDADESVNHQPIVTTRGECLCLAATAGPLTFASWPARLGACTRSRRFPAARRSPRRATPAGHGIHRWFLKSAILRRYRALRWTEPLPDRRWGDRTIAIDVMASMRPVKARTCAGSSWRRVGTAGVMDAHCRPPRAIGTRWLALPACASRRAASGDARCWNRGLNSSRTFHAHQSRAQRSNRQGPRRQSAAEAEPV